MQKINSQASLQEAILQLEIKQADEAILLKEQFHETYESVRPVNLIRNFFNRSDESVELKATLLNTGVGLTAGFLSKILFQGFSRSPVRKMIGTALMFGITNMAVKNPGTINSLAGKIINILQILSVRRQQKKEKIKEE